MGIRRAIARLDQNPFSKPTPTSVRMKLAQNISSAYTLKVIPSGNNEFAAEHHHGNHPTRMGNGSWIPCTLYLHVSMQVIQWRWWNAAGGMSENDEKILASSKISWINMAQICRLRIFASFWKLFVKKTCELRAAPTSFRPKPPAAESLWHRSYGRASPRRWFPEVAAAWRSWSWSYYLRFEQMIAILSCWGYFQTTTTTTTTTTNNKQKGAQLHIRP